MFSACAIVDLFKIVGPNFQLAPYFVQLFGLLRTLEKPWFDRPAWMAGSSQVEPGHDVFWNLRSFDYCLPDT